MPFKVSTMIEVDDSATTYDPDETTIEETSMILLGFDSNKPSPASLPLSVENENVNAAASSSHASSSGYDDEHKHQARSKSNVSSGERNVPLDGITDSKGDNSSISGVNDCNNNDSDEDDYNASSIHDPDETVLDASGHLQGDHGCHLEPKTNHSNSARYAEMPMSQHVRAEQRGKQTQKDDKGEDRCRHEDRKLSYFSNSDSEKENKLSEDSERQLGTQKSTGMPSQTQSKINRNHPSQSQSGKLTLQHARQSANEASLNLSTDRANATASLASTNTHKHKGTRISMPSTASERVYKESYASVVKSIIHKNQHLVNIPVRASQHNYEKDLNQCSPRGVDDRISNLYHYMETGGIYKILQRLGIKHAGNGTGAGESVKIFEAESSWKEHANTSDFGSNYSDNGCSGNSRNGHVSRLQQQKHSENPMEIEHSESTVEAANLSTDKYPRYDHGHDGDLDADLSSGLNPTTVPMEEESIVDIDDSADEDYARGKSPTRMQQQDSNDSRNHSFNLSSVYTSNQMQDKALRPRQDLNQCSANLDKNDDPHLNSENGSVSSIELPRHEAPSNHGNHYDPSIRINVPESFQSPSSTYTQDRSSLASKKRMASTSGKRGLDYHRMRMEDETSFHPIYEEFSQQVNDIMKSPTVKDFEIDDEDGHGLDCEKGDSPFLDSALFSQSPIPHRNSILTQVDESVDIRRNEETETEGRIVNTAPSKRLQDEENSFDTESRAQNERGSSPIGGKGWSGRMQNSAFSLDKRVEAKHTKRRPERSRGGASPPGHRNSRRPMSVKEKVRSDSIDSFPSFEDRMSDDAKRSGTGSFSTSKNVENYPWDSDLESDRFSERSKEPDHRSSHVSVEKRLGDKSRMRRSRRYSSDSDNKSFGANKSDCLHSPCRSFNGDGEDSIESVDSAALREQEYRKKYNHDESIIDDDTDIEHNISLRDSSRLYYNPLRVCRPPRRTKSKPKQKKVGDRRRREEENCDMPAQNYTSKKSAKEIRPLPTLTMIQEPFKEFGSRDADRLEVVSDWLNDCDNTGSNGDSGDISCSDSGKAIVLSVTNRQILSLTLQVLLSNDVHSISRYDRHIDSSNSLGTLSVERHGVERGGTLIIARSKDELVDWECALREKTVFTVLNHAELTSTERRRITIPQKVSGFDIVLTTYDALKVKEVARQVDDKGRVVERIDSQGGWLKSRMVCSEEEQHQNSVLCHLHTLNWFRLIFSDNLGRQSYLTKPGTARVQAAATLKAQSRIIFFEKSSCNTYFFEDKVKESRRQLVPLARILGISENRTADKLVDEAMLDFRDVQEIREEKELLESECESCFSDHSDEVERRNATFSDYERESW